MIISMQLSQARMPVVVVVSSSNSTGSMNKKQLALCILYFVLCNTNLVVLL